MKTVAVIFLIVIATSCQGGYLIDGDDLPECWETDLATTISTYLSSGCPSTISLSYSDAGPSELTAGMEYPVSYKISTSLPVVKYSFSDVSHGNLHSCMTSIGACVPNILVTPGLVTQTAASIANFTSVNGVNEATLYATLNLEEGNWVSLAHVKIYTTTLMYSVAVASFKTVVPAPIPIEIILITKAIRDGWLSCAVISAFICLLIAGAIIAFRSRKVIKYATSSFCIIMAIGASIGAISPIPYGYVTDSSCMARPLLPMLAFTLFFAPLVLKTWRVHQLFTARNFTKQKISDTKLMLMLVCLVFIDLIIYTAWMATVARPVPRRNSVDGSDYQTTMECSSDANDNVFTAIVIYKGLILLSGSMLAYSTRKVPSLFNESKYIAQCQYVLILFMALGIPLIRLVNGQPDLVFAITTIVMSFSSVSISIIFFAPKFWIVYTVDDSQLQGFKDSEHAANKTEARRRKSAVTAERTGSIDSSYITTESEIEQGDGIGPTKVVSKPARSTVAIGTLPPDLLISIKMVRSKTSNIIDRDAIGYIVRDEELADLLESCNLLSEEIAKIKNKRVAGCTSQASDTKATELWGTVGNIEKQQ